MTLQEVVRKRIADLQIKSMLFDMAIDWEILELVEKNELVDAVWLRRWKDKVKNSDRPTTGGLEDVDYE